MHFIIDSFLFKFELQELKIFWAFDCPRSRITRRELLGHYFEINTLNLVEKDTC